MLMVLTYDQSFDWVLFILNRNWIGLVSAKLHSPMRGLSWLLLITLVTLGKSPWISVMMKVYPVFLLESGKLWWTSWEKIGWFYPLCKYVYEFPWLWVVFFSTIFCFYNFCSFILQFTDFCWWSCGLRVWLVISLSLC